MARKAKKTVKKASKKTKKTVSKKSKTKSKKISKVKKAVSEPIKALRIKKIDYSKRKLNIVLGNLTFFVIIFVLSTILYSISKTEFYLSLFFMLSLIMGVFSIALLIVLLIFVFMKFMNK